jgi:serine/threonine protein kinase
MRAQQNQVERERKRTLTNELIIYEFLEGKRTTRGRDLSFMPKLLYAGSFLIVRAIAIEFIEGEHILFGKMSPEQREACMRALVSLHQCNVLHGDIRYQNFLLTKSGTVKIIDFGFSKIIEPRNKASKHELKEEENQLRELFEQSDEDSGYDELIKQNE